MPKKEWRLFSWRSVLVLFYVAAVALIPLAVRLRVMDYGAPIETWPWFLSGEVFDLMAQFRLEVLVGLTACLVLAALLQYYYEHDEGGIAPSYLDYPTAVFAGLIALSALTSPYIHMAFWGFYERGEGAVAYFCYLLLFMIAATCLRGEGEKKVIFYAILAAGLIQALVAAGQYFGYDFLQSEFYRPLLIPAEYRPLLEEGAELKARITSKAYGFTYNPNYLGGYMAMLLPMGLVLYLYSSSRLLSAASLVAILLFGLGLVAASSTGAYLALGMTLLALLILTGRDIRAYYKRLLPLLLLLVCLVVFAGPRVEGIIQQQVKKIKASYSRLMAEEDMPVDTPAISDKFPEVGARDPIELEIERHPLDSLASGRGYIWRKSGELMLRDNLLLGSGLDTLLYNFPFWTADRASSRRVGLLVDKPHNTYLQIGLGVGLPGLLLYLYMLASHFVNYMRVYRHRGVQNSSDAIMLAVFAGWLAYLFQGLSNDSVLSNAPVFWVAFGLSANYVQGYLPELPVAVKEEAGDGKAGKGAEKQRAKAKRPRRKKK